MSKVLITRSKLDGLASTIAAKSGATLPLTIAQMDAAVQGISGDAYTRTEVVPSQTVTPDSNRVSSFTATTPFVDGEYYVVTYDGTEYVVTAETLWTNNIILGDAQVVWQTSDVLYPFALITTANDSDGYFVSTSTHTIKVEMLEFTGDATILSSKSITANGTYAASADSADGYASVTVNVPSSSPTLQAKSATPTTSQQTISPDSGYDGLSSVTVAAMPTGTAGTPTATKGSVSNHSVSVTPSVTNTTGYITGSTKTGTAVTVSASELVSGSETKTANGTYDVTNLAELVVNVAGSSVKTATGTFTGNGTRTIDISSVTFEPDIVYFTSDPGTTSSSGTVAAIIVRGQMTATRYRNNSTTNSHYAIPDITGMNTSGSSYSWRATYDSTNSKLTLYCYSNNARALLTNGRTYTYTFVKWT